MRLLRTVRPLSLRYVILTQQHGLKLLFYFGVTIHTPLSSAGVGRTGTFIAIDSIQEQVKNEKIIDIA